jgi:hypothetical protein
MFKKSSELSQFNIFTSSLSLFSGDEVKNRLQELGVLIYKILPLFSSSAGSHYQTLQRVFNEQFRVDEKKVVVAREKEEISAKSVQSPHDTDYHYRNKDTQKIKGYSINVTESCDDDDQLNLIGHVDVKKASTSDVGFLSVFDTKTNDIVEYKSVTCRNATMLKQPFFSWVITIQTLRQDTGVKSSTKCGQISVVCE